MTILYLDCQAGISGDMTLAALIDAGAPIEPIQETLRHLLPQFRLDISTEQVTRGGVGGLHLRIGVDDPHCHRTFREIAAMIDASSLDPAVRQRGIAIFRRLAEVEGKIHGLSPGDVHFHEVGGVDSIIDIVGVSLALHHLGIETIHASPLPLDRGFVQCDHGTLPLPAPATLELLTGFTLFPSPLEGETVTPTGAAILAVCGTPVPPPPFVPLAVGYGAGSRDHPGRPNLLRAVIGRVDPAVERDEVTVVTTNVDDSTPEALGFVMERLFDDGALDVTFTPVQMKKDRPGVTITVIARPADGDRLARLLLLHTSTLGVRMERVGRILLPRKQDEVQTPFGPVRVTVARVGGVAKVIPEYGDCARIARERGLTLSAVMDAAVRGWQE